ncbi:Glycosyl transferase, group 1 domain protein, partial [mine drainage metagenome]
VYPSINEGYGINAVEARLLGIKIVATRTGAIPEILDGMQNAIVVEPKSEDDLRDGILSLISSRPADNNPCSPEVMDKSDLRHTIDAYLNFPR